MATTINHIRIFPGGSDECEISFAVRDKAGAVAWADTILVSLPAATRDAVVAAAQQTVDEHVAADIEVRRRQLVELT